MNLLDIQSWWEIPSIAHFCSLFRSNFDLPQFDIEELEFALLNDVADSSNAAGLLSASLHPNLLADLVFGLVRGSKPQSYRNRVNHSNYQSVLRELLQHHCEPLNIENPFTEERPPFEELTSHNKVRILQLLCDIRLDAEDVPSIFATLQPESLRVDPVGRDAKGATYWYFFGTRLYRDNAPIKVRTALPPASKKRPTFSTVYEWRLVCQTPDDWDQLAAQFQPSKNREEIALHCTLIDDFLPNIRSMFVQQEQLKRKKLVQANLYANIRRSSRVVKPSLKHSSRSETASPLSDLSGSATPIRRQSSANGDADSGKEECEPENVSEFDDSRQYPARRYRQPPKRFTL